MFTSVVLHCKVIKPYHTMTGLKKTWNTSCHESQVDLKWRLRQSLISRQQGLHESLDSYVEFINSTCRRLGVSKENQFYYFVNGLRAEIKCQV